MAADAAHGGQDDFRAELRAAGLPFVRAFKERRGMWRYHADVYTPKEAVRPLVPCTAPNSRQVNGRISSTEQRPAIGAGQR